MLTRRIESLAATEVLSAVFADEEKLRCMLGFEGALALALARVGAIPADAAAAIADTAVAESFDTTNLARQSLRADTLAIRLVRILAIAAARRTLGLLANFLAGTVQEHECAVWMAVRMGYRAGHCASGGRRASVHGRGRRRPHIGCRADAAQYRGHAGDGVRREGNDAAGARNWLRRAHRAVEEIIRKTGSPPALPGLREPGNYLGSTKSFRLRLLKGE